jgi:hypothetical protein
MRSDGLLFAHILSAMILVGGVLTVVVVPQAAQHRAWPAQVPILRALAAVTALFVGFAITDIDLIVGGVILTLVKFWVLRRTRAGKPGGWQASLATALPWLVLAALVAAIVLMAGKPVG